MSKINKGQVTLDVLIAIFLSLFVLTWLQGYITIQQQEAEKQGISQETASIAISEGSVMNTFYAMNPSDMGDYAAIPGLETTRFLEDTDTYKQKEYDDEELQIESHLDDLIFEYAYRVPETMVYYEECPDGEIEGEPCVRYTS